MKDKLLNGMMLEKIKYYQDERGSFAEIYRKNKSIHNLVNFVQENQSMSNKNVIRGLHFQYPNYQAKLIRVVKGKILDVCVDLNKNSPTYLQHTKIELSDENGLCLFVPTKYAHGFLSLEDNTIVNYKCSNYYYPNEQFGIIWNDKSLNINWGINKPLLSKKDLNLPPLKGIK